MGSCPTCARHADDYLIAEILLLITLGSATHIVLDRVPGSFEDVIDSVIAAGFLPPVAPEPLRPQSEVFAGRFDPTGSCPIRARRARDHFFDADRNLNDVFGYTFYGHVPDIRSGRDERFQV